MIPLNMVAINCTHYTLYIVHVNFGFDNKKCMASRKRLAIRSMWEMKKIKKINMISLYFVCLTSSICWMSKQFIFQYSPLPTYYLVLRKTKKKSDTINFVRKILIFCVINFFFDLFWPEISHTKWKWSTNCCIYVFLRQNSIALHFRLPPTNCR